MDLPPSGRDAAVDTVRAVALLSMFVAHGVPYAPGGLWALSDFLTAALFAMLVGVGGGLSEHSGRAALLGWFVRGLVLILVGLLLEKAGAQVYVILVHLGALTWVVALLRPLPSLVLAGCAAWLALVAPPLQESWQGVYRELLLERSSVLARVVDVVLTGVPYRLITLTIWAIVGLLLARHVLRSGTLTAQREMKVGAIVLGLALVAYLGLGRLGGNLELVPYSGTWLEIGFNALLASGVLLCVVGAGRGRDRRVLAQLGQMSLSIYTLHVLWLALLARTVFEGRTDDSWWTFASLVVGALAVAAAWSRVPRSSRWARGPLEAGSDALVGLVRRAAT